MRLPEMNETKLNVLIIEDDEDDFILTSELLHEVKNTAYDITWVSKYSEALPAMWAGGFDVCLIDFRLGEGTGIELMRKAIAAGCSLPMILLTGQGDSEVDLEATQAGAADYLVKGEVEPQLLERTIRHALARSKMLETLMASEKRFRSIVESAHDAIVLTDDAGIIISWNKAAETMFGYTNDEIIGRPVGWLFNAESRDAGSAQYDPMAEAGLHPDTVALETIGVKKDDVEFPIEVSVSSWETAKGTFYSAIVRDVTVRKSLEDQLTHQALHDPLTKLANRLLFTNRVEHALSRLDRSRSSVAVLFLDLDNFKTINDTLGHAAGDELLVSVAERLQACLRNSDTPARLGGDEFAVLIEDSVTAEGALLAAERIKDVLQTPFILAGKEVFVGTSIGIASTTLHNETTTDLLRNADVAMYMAKTQGKGRYAVFENAMHDALVERVELEAELRRAIENNELIVHYQPIVTLDSDTIMGMEALVRWNHPRHGLLGPDTFIPLAEETKLIEPIGSWVLEEACRQTSIWQKHFGLEGRLSITVNISGRQFKGDELTDAVASALERSGLSPYSLILEITENTMLQNTDATMKKMAALKELGVRLAIDDFGTGYSSLSYLQRFPVDVLKIDKSFIARINSGHEGAAVARAIISMSDTLRLNTIAEGIESPDQIDALKVLGCELGQGFHFAKPLDEGSMVEFLENAFKDRNENWNLGRLTGHNQSQPAELSTI